MTKKKLGKFNAKKKLDDFNKKLKRTKFSNALKGKISERHAELLDKYIYLVITGYQEDIFNVLKFVIVVSKFVAKYKSLAWIVLFLMLLSTYKGMAEVIGYEQLYTYIVFLIMWYILKMNYNIGVIRSEVERYVKECKKEDNGKTTAK